MRDRALLAMGMVALAAGVWILPAHADEQAVLRRAFQTLDQNGDGTVTEDEFEQNKVKVFFSGLEEFRRDHSLAFEETVLSREAFDAADTNGDGRLSGSEWVLAPFAQYGTYDPNGSGAVTREEFARSVAPFLRAS